MKVILIVLKVLRILRLMKKKRFLFMLKVWKNIKKFILMKCMIIYKISRKANLKTYKIWILNNLRIN